jgi:hypothetical protein
MNSKSPILKFGGDRIRRNSVKFAKFVNPRLERFLFLKIIFLCRLTYVADTKVQYLVSVHNSRYQRCSIFLSHKSYILV